MTPDTPPTPTDDALAAIRQRLEAIVIMPDGEPGISVENAFKTQAWRWATLTQVRVWKQEMKRRRCIIECIEVDPKHVDEHSDGTVHLCYILHGMPSPEGAGFFSWGMLHIAVHPAYVLAALAAHEQAEAALREAAQPLMEDYDAYLEGKASGDVHWHDLFWEWASAWRDHERLSDSIEKLYVLYKQGGNDDD